MSKQHNTRSRTKNTSTFSDKRSLSDEEVTAQTYGISPILPSENIEQPAKFQAMDVDNPAIPAPSTSTLDNTTHALSSEPDISSRDISNKKRDAPIEPNQDAMMVDPIINSQSGSVTTQPSIPNKGKSTAVDQIVQLHDIFKVTSPQANISYEVFIPRDSFNKDKSDKDILDEIKQAFLLNKDASKFRIGKTLTYTYFVISVRTAELFNELISQPITALYNVRAFEFKQSSIETLINNKFKAQNDNIIKILDVPFNYDVKLLVKRLANATGKSISSYKELKKPPKSIRNCKRNGAPILLNPTYKQVIIGFVDKSAADYLLQQTDWGLAVEDFFVRILPGNTKHPEFLKRTSHYFTVTGIPLNTNVFDLQSLISHLKGRTCTFSSTRNTSLQKSAYIYYDPTTHSDGQIVDVFTTPFHNTSLYVYKNMESFRTCGNCGSTLHEVVNCPDTNFITNKYKEKVFQKCFIKRNKVKISLDNDTKAAFNNVIQLNRIDSLKSNKPKPSASPSSSQSTQSRSSGTSSQSKSSPITPATLSTVSSADYNSLTNRIVQLEKLCQTLTNELAARKDFETKTFEEFKKVQESSEVVNTKLAHFDQRLNSAEVAFAENSTVLQTILQGIQDIKDSTASTKPARGTSPRKVPYQKKSYNTLKQNFIEQQKSAYDDYPQYSGDEMEHSDDGNVSDASTVQEIVEPDSVIIDNSSSSSTASFVKRGLGFLGQSY